MSRTMAALIRSAVLIASAMQLAVMPVPTAGFVYFLDPQDVANHFACAVNSSMSPFTMLRIADNIRYVANVTRNYTGNPEKLAGRLPYGVIERMGECEALHQVCFPSTSLESADMTDGSIETLLQDFTGSSANPTRPAEPQQQPQCDLDVYIPLVMRCYREADVLFFKAVSFNDESELTVQYFRDCLESALLSDNHDK